MEFGDGNLMQPQGKFKLYIWKPWMVTGDLKQKQLRRIEVHEWRCEEQRINVLYEFSSFNTGIERKCYGCTASLGKAEFIPTPAPLVRAQTSRCYSFFGNSGCEVSTNLFFKIEF